PGTLSADAETELPPADPSAPAGQALADGSITITAADSDRPGSWAGIHVQDQGQLRLHGVALERGGDRGEGVVLAEGASTLRLESCRFSADLVGVELRGSEVVVEVFSDNDFAEVPVALRIGPEQLGTVAGDNHYDEAARIEVARGKVEHDASWAVQGAPIHLLGDVYVDKNATLTVAAGNRLAFAAGAVLGVGYYQRGALDMRASADAPIVLGPAEDGQRWGGVVLGGFARDTHLEHVRLRSSEGPGVELREQAEATLVKVDCAGCGGATVKWSCAAKVGNIGVTASDGTPAALAAPSGCK
ncbi:MAG: hypothetical protein KC431_20055, partial [Myxococcales bacterium]|nr:hypothetical protein [Myxococcales bacterium]